MVFTSIVNAVSNTRGSNRGNLEQFSMRQHRLPPGIRGGMIFVSSARQVGQLLNFKSQGGDTFRGEGGGGDDFRQSSRGGGRRGGELLYHGELLVFP